MLQFLYLSTPSICSSQNLLMKTQGNRTRVKEKKKKELGDRGNKSEITVTGERWVLSISLALPIRQEGPAALCVFAHYILAYFLFPLLTFHFPSQ